MSQPSANRNEALFQPDAILPPQFFASLRRHAPSKAGEWQLMVAVLEDAVQCFKKHLLAKDRQGQRLYRDAEAWLMSDSCDVGRGADDTAALPFQYVCDVLGLDAASVRHGLRRWRERDRAPAAGPETRKEKRRSA